MPNAKPKGGMAATKAGDGAKRAADPTPRADKKAKIKEEKPEVKQEGTVGSGRQAAQNLKLKEERVKSERSSKDYLMVKEFDRAGDEAEALTKTMGDSSASSTGLPRRRLGDFSLANSNGIFEPLAALDGGAQDLRLSGVIYPESGTASKATGVAVTDFGPATGFQVELDGPDGVRLVVRTAAATYELLKPSAGYKKTLGAALAEAALVRELARGLNPALGGALDATLDELVLRVARAKIPHGYPSARDALLLAGRFVLQQLGKLDAVSGPKGIKYLETDACRALTAEVGNYKYKGSQGANAGIVIRDVSAPSPAPEADGEAAARAAAEEADAAFARQLQAQMDAAAVGGRGGGGGAGRGAGQPYLQVSPEEIADDYPAPLAYAKEEEEMDELLLAEEEDFGVTDPDALPRRVLTDFSVYNSEGWLSSLELLPMWAGVDPGVELYASGVVLEDEGDMLKSGHALEFDSVDAGSKLDAAGDAGAATAAVGESSSADDAAGGSSSSADDAAGGSLSSADAAGGSLSSADAAGGSSSSATPAAEPQGMRLCLSQVKDWVVEMGPEVVLISLRTDVAWYRLAAPASRYAPWFAPVLKTARLAARVLSWLSSEPRASRLSFADVVKRLAAEPEGASTAVSRTPARVERWLVVHGAILLNQFAAWPAPAVRRSAFCSTLKTRMLDVRHSKLYRRVVAPPRAPGGGRAVNRNPMKDRAAGARSKPMTATATVMVKAVWQSYFSAGGVLAKEGGEESADAGKQAEEGPLAQPVEEDENADDGDEEEDVQEDALAVAGGKPATPTAAVKAAAAVKATEPATRGELLGELLHTDGSGLKYYGSARLGGLEFGLGDVVQLAEHSEINSDEEEATDKSTAPLPRAGIVQAMWVGKSSAVGGSVPRMQVRLLAHGVDTVLGDAASDAELFLTTDHETVSLKSDVVTGLVTAPRLVRAWDHRLRAEQFAEDEALRAANAAARAQGLPGTYFWRREYVPREGMFRDAPVDLELGTRLPEPEAPEMGPAVTLPGGAGFRVGGVEYKVGNCLFLSPGVLDAVDGARPEVALPEYLSNSRFHKGSHVGLRAWGIAQLVEVKPAGKAGGAPVKSLTVQRYYRPEDISEDLAYAAPSFYAVYASQDERLEVCPTDVCGACAVVPRGGPLSIASFECIGTYDRAKGVVGEPPENLRSAAQDEAVAEEPVVAEGTVVVSEATFPGDDGVSLATMDIFAGCGGLSEGMHAAGAAHTRWAIEYEYAAAEAFKLNNPRAATFCANCNVLLHAAMDKAGLGDECEASSEAVAESAALPEAERAALPAPGEVGFICGGPPCQGYSGMNRFNKGNWSMVQNSMVMSFLSYADFYRPRYFLLENVRNFVSHNKSFTFRLTLRCLLDMGYQVRFGVLNAGNFGVAQSRKRTFIWAAAPGEGLPDWPRLAHAFRTPQLTINLPNGVQYTAVPQTAGAPLRPVTVRDAIADLPVIANGADAEVMPYDGPATSAFQRGIRGACPELYDHISKTMNALNLERCRCIPKGVPGADWRVLEQIVRDDPSREKFQGQPLVPWCLPNTADRHNGWRGLFGRLDPRGHFPTSTTDPQPMGKVGQVFHPDQDRIVSVRECARAQGFPDKHRFWGNVHNKHRQVGNAVPPPLAAALGRQLRKKLEEKLSSMDTA